LAFFKNGSNNNALFETDGPFVHLHHSQMSGNPVRIGDGYATVTGYKLPWPLVTDREGGSEVKAPSQDIDLIVLVAVPPCGINFSVKRRMRPALSICFRQDR
jgi:hypothetical protein